MSTAAPSKRQLQPNMPPPGRGMGARLQTMLSSTVGQKYLVAISGIVLVLFVIGHLAGNLNVFRGRDALNHYAAFLKSQPGLLWTARIVLLVLFVLHIVVSLRLRYLSAQARPVKYSFHQYIQASLASRTMVYTGLVILAFVTLHIAHYTLGVVGSAEVKQPNGEWVRTGLLDLHSPYPADPKDHDVYAMTWVGFHQPVIAILYIIAQLALILHMSHGVGSIFQTFGLNAPRVQPAISALSWIVALVVGLGNILIVVAVWANMVAPPPYDIRW